MARQQSDREDLLAEAVALVRRAEWQVGDVLVLIGTRPTGCLSVYLGQDRSYQFDEAGRLRRAYADPDLFRTQGTTLAQLTRTRTDGESHLLRTDLSQAALVEFRREMLARLEAVLQSIGRADNPPRRQVPVGDPTVTSSLRDQLAAIVNSSRSDWLAPAIRGKR